MKILVFAKYLAYATGGAEVSMFEILKQTKNARIKVSYFDRVSGFSAKNRPVSFPEAWDRRPIKHTISLKKFVYFEYLLNRRKLQKYFHSLDSEDILYTYGIYAPVAVNSFLGQSKIFVRSETDLGVNTNYHSGLKRLFKRFYMLVEYPAYFIYRRDLKKALNKSHVIFNSGYMQRKGEELYNAQGEVVYPFIDEVRLKNDFKLLCSEQLTRGVVFVGDSKIKGLDIAKRVAIKMPDIPFFIFSRYVDKPKRKGNIVTMPWQKNVAEVYKYAKVVIVPSICEEGYGRVAREAFVLGIPTLVSNRGGLPEAVNDSKDSIVENYTNPDVWTEKIANFF